MKMKKILYEATEFKDVREIIANSVKQYPDNIAFIIKKKNGEEISYTKITYSEFQDDINRLGTALADLGLKYKRVAIIRTKQI